MIFSGNSISLVVKGIYFWQEGEQISGIHDLCINNPAKWMCW